MYWIESAQSSTLPKFCISSWSIKQLVHMIPFFLYCPSPTTAISRVYWLLLEHIGCWHLILLILLIISLYKFYAMNVYRPPKSYIKFYNSFLRDSIIKNIWIIE